MVNIQLCSPKHVPPNRAVLSSLNAGWHLQVSWAKALAPWTALPSLDFPMSPTVATLLPTIRRRRPNEVRNLSGPEHMPSLFVRANQ